MTWTDEQVRAMHQANQAGESLASIGRRYGISHETVRRLFIEHGYERRSPAEMAAQKRQGLAEQAESHRVEIITLYKAHGTIDAVVAHLDPPIPRRFVAEIIATIPDRESYRRRGGRPTYLREELIAHLQRARDHAGEPLSGMTYQVIAPGLGLAAFNTQVNMFGSFSKALHAAGVKGNPLRGRRKGAFTPEVCIEAVMACVRDHNGRRVSYDEYREWAAYHTVPSGPTVRNLLGWNPAIQSALDRLASRVR